MKQYKEMYKRAVLSMADEQLHLSTLTPSERRSYEGEIEQLAQLTLELMSKYAKNVMDLDLEEEERLLQEFGEMMGEDGKTYDEWLEYYG